MHEVVTETPQSQSSRKVGHNKPATPPVVTERILKQSRDSAPGRHLAFVFGPRSVQMACTAHGIGGKTVIDVRKEFLTSQINDPAERANLLSEKVRNYVTQFGGRWPHVTVAISDRETTHRSFLMPQLKKKDLDSAISFEVKKKIPFPEEESLYDYTSISEITKGDVKKLKVSLLAATRRRVNEALEPFRLCGVKVNVVGHSQELIGQLLHHQPEFDPDSSMTLINLTPNHTEISFYRGSILQFHHIASIAPEHANPIDASIDFETISVNLAKEIITSLDFYAGLFPYSTTDRIFVYGDLAFSDEMLHLLNGRTGIEFIRFPAESLSFAGNAAEKFGSELAVCLPALAAASINVKCANLLPPAEKLDIALKRSDRIGRVALVVLFFSLLAVWFVLQRNNSVQQTTLDDLNQQITAFTNSEAYHTYNNIKREIERDQRYLQQAEKKPTYLSLSFKELTLLTPESIRFINVIYQPTSPEANMIIHGIVRSHDIPPEIIFAEYIETVKTSPFFDHVQITKHVKKKLDAGFQIEFQLTLQGVA